MSQQRGAWGSGGQPAFAIMAGGCQWVCPVCAKVAELVDAQDLGSCGVTRESSSLSFRTNPGAIAMAAGLIKFGRLPGGR